MQDPLRAHILRFVPLGEESLSAVADFFHPVGLHKKETLLEAGQVCRTHYFVVKGCLRMFFINEKGIEQTTQFALENWWMTDYAAFSQQRTSEWSIQAVEKTEVMAISFAGQQRMLESVPQMERYFRLVYERAYAASQMRMKLMYDFSREELYRHFAASFPQFVQRIPQYLLASYLGFTPEYLSEIRKRRP